MRTLLDKSERGQEGAGIVDGKVARLIATGASMAANNESRFAESVKGLKAAGVPENEIRLAVQIGQIAKDRPAGIMKTMADRLTGTGLTGETPRGGCPVEGMKQTPAYPLVMLIAAGSAMSANCEPCLNKVIPDLIEAGVADADIRTALEIGQSVKDDKAGIMKEAADILAGTNLLGQPVAASLQTTDPPPWSACGCA